jgi:hypothetical protein
MKYSTRSGTASFQMSDAIDSETFYPERIAKEQQPLDHVICGIKRLVEVKGKVRYMNY